MIGRSAYSISMRVAVILSYVKGFGFSDDQCLEFHYRRNKGVNHDDLARITDCERST